MLATARMISIGLHYGDVKTHVHTLLDNCCAAISC